MTEELPAEAFGLFRPEGWDSKWRWSYLPGVTNRLIEPLSLKEYQDGEILLVPQDTDLGDGSVVVQCDNGDWKAHGEIRPLSKLT
jgi:hypothetical protein